MTGPRLPRKKDVAVALLERASVFVHLDPRADDVRVPNWLKQRVPLVLQVGLNLAVPIVDLDVGDDALSCTLSFQRRPYYCYLPWTAVYALVGEDQRGMVWPDDVPPEVTAQAQQQQVKQKRSSLRAVPQRSDEGPDAPEEGSADRGVDDLSAQELGIDREGLATPEPSRIQASDTPSVSELEGDEPPEPSSPSRDSDESPPSPKGRKLPPYLRIVK